MKVLQKIGLLAKIRGALYRALAVTNPKDIGAIILCYHGIGNDEWKYNVTAEKFKIQLDYLNYRYKSLSLNDIKKIADGTAASPKTPAFVICFDDGYKDVLLVKDYLKTKGIKPVLFVLAEPENANRTELDNNKQLLSDDEIRSLIEDGWEIGSHGCTHPNFWELSDKEIEHEVTESKKILENKYNTKIRCFSYPKGRYTDKIIAAVKKAGYEMAVTMDDDFITEKTNLYLLPRIGINQSHSFNEFRVTMMEPVVKARKFIKNFAGGALKRFL